MTTELTAVLQSITDRNSRLVAADYLEEVGRNAEAKILRGPDPFHLTPSFQIISAIIPAGPKFVFEFQGSEEARYSDICVARENGEEDVDFVTGYEIAKRRRKGFEIRDREEWSEMCFALHTGTTEIYVSRRAMDKVTDALAVMGRAMGWKRSY